MQNVHLDASPRLVAGFPWLIVLAWLGWAAFVYAALRDHWIANPQYTYGFLVPVLAGVLGWRRWQTRPELGSPMPGAWLLLVVSAAALFPIWIIAQPNAEWRLVPWALMATFLGGSLALVSMAGGRAWLRHFAFPVIFAATAVPWPGFIEAPMVDGLMHFVAEATVVILNIVGIPALQVGNLVKISTGVLGVDEACSGVRSVQATLMAALFLGELHRLTAGARATLVALGFAAALITNIGRTWFLAHTAASEGIASISRFHDPAGYTIFTVCLVIVALAAEVLRRKHAITSPVTTNSRPHPLSSRLGGALAAWFAIVLGGTEVWYAHGEVHPVASWTAVPPAEAAPRDLSREVTQLLACDRQQSLVWRDSRGAQWTQFFLEWFPGAGRAVILARAHRPEQCLPSLGLREVGPRRVVSITVSGITLDFDSMHFRDARGGDYFVFFCPWEIGPNGGRTVVFNDASRRASLQRVWRRERHLGQQTLELIVTGYHDRDEAETAFLREAGRIVQPAEGR